MLYVSLDVEMVIVSGVLSDAVAASTVLALGLGFGQVASGFSARAFSVAGGPLFLPLRKRKKISAPTIRSTNHPLPPPEEVLAVVAGDGVLAVGGATDHGGVGVVLGARAVGAAVGGRCGTGSALGI
jgi:hypothetical protein